jgi:hypothetical protein
VLLSLVFIPSGCGDEQTTAVGEAAAGEPATSSATTKSSEAAAGAVGQASGRTGRSKRAAECRRSLGGLLDAMESLNNTVAVGLDYEGYLDSVNHVRAAYAGVQADRLGIACLVRAAGPAERALNVYIDAANTWGNCLATASCDPEEVEPKLQRKWAEASTLLTSAQSGLRELG